MKNTDFEITNIMNSINITNSDNSKMSDLVMPTPSNPTKVDFLQPELVVVAVLH